MSTSSPSSKNLICPFCKRKIELKFLYKDFILYECIQKNHEYWNRENVSWFITYKDTLFIDSNNLMNNITCDTYIAFDKPVSKTKAAQILKRFIKLQTFI
jgi:hypothetical protein